MSSDSITMLTELLRSFSTIDYVHPEDIPNIDLYVDQVTTFIDSQLESVKRSPDDKTLTKTMINNYTKSHVLPSPDKKKYSRDHILTLILIYYLKSFLSIKDIQAIINPITDKYFGKENDISFFNVYTELVDLETNEAHVLVKDLVEKYRAAQGTFATANEEDQEFLHNFSFLCSLAFDVYIKKMMIEHLVDSFSAETKKQDENDEKKDSTRKDSAKKDSAKKDSAKKDSSHKENNKSE